MRANYLGIAPSSSANQQQSLTRAWLRPQLLLVEQPSASDLRSPLAALDGLLFDVSVLPQLRARIDGRSADPHWDGIDLLPERAPKCLQSWSK